MIVFGLAVALTSAGAVTGGVVSLKFMDSPEFCGACHTMKPELHAYEQSVHRGVDCAECHIGPGIEGFVRAKLDGSIQLFQLVTNTYERPIPPAAHRMLQSAVAQNCTRCHKEAPSRWDRLVVQRHFAEDEANTEYDVGLVVKVGNASRAAGRGIHWHVGARVEYLAKDAANQREIDYIKVTDPSGGVTDYASRALAIRLATATPAEATLTRSTLAPGLVTMTCINCHNRVGHEFLAPGPAIDEALASGKLDRQLPYLKKQALELLTADYTSTGEAYAAIGGLAAWYQQTYPATYARREGEVREATRVLQELFGRVASPEMQATYRDYPSQLGHRGTEGCFRCHDGMHVKLDAAGKPTRATIPSDCATCHTPPQLADASSLEALLGVPPATHKANMLFDHASVIRDEGATSRCALCHQPASCARCHESDVLNRPPTRPLSTRP